MVESAIGSYAQSVWLHFDVAHWFFPFVLHPCLVRSHVPFP